MAENHDERILGVIEEIRQFNLSINDEQPIELFADGLCENPGAMHIGLFARQGSNCLFARHLAVGYGTCNEAEYIAVKTGLTILQALYPSPRVAIVVASDSQLVTKQVNGEWKSSGRMLSYCIFLRRLRKTYPFELRKIPRTENMMADGLAQKYILKNSGRCMTLENGRFHVSKQVPATVKTANTYKAVTSQEFREHLESHNLNRELRELLRLAKEGQQAAAVKLSQEVLQRAETILSSAPKTNDLVAQWVNNTMHLIRQSVAHILESVQAQDAVNVQYVVEELSGIEETGNGLYDLQLSCLNDGQDLRDRTADIDEIEDELVWED